MNWLWHRKLRCRLLGHDWDEKFIPSVQAAAREIQPLWVAGGGMAKPCNRCGSWKWVG